MRIGTNELLIILVVALLIFGPVSYTHLYDRVTEERKTLPDHIATCLCGTTAGQEKYRRFDEMCIRDSMSTVEAASRHCCGVPPISSTAADAAIADATPMARS